MLSVIIPIYNTEKYLPKCLDSIIQQDYSDLEILCINDGSTDGSLTILIDYQKKDNRITVINKANSGYGDTMNTGIRTAKGSYICIVESDDFVAAGSFRRLVNTAEQFDADVVKGNYYLYTQESKAKLNDNLSAVKKNQLLEDLEIKKLFFVAPSIWSAVYKRAFLTDNEIWFRCSPGASYQDTSFAFKVWAAAKRVVALEDGVIYYRTDNMESSSNETNKVSDISAEFEEIEKTIRKLGRNDLWSVFIRVKYISYVWNMNRLVPDKKIQFLNSVYEEFVSARKNGWLDKTQWPESDWIVFHRLLERFDKYKADLLKGKAFWEAGM